MNILAIDYGEKRVGFALARDGQITALPLLEINDRFELRMYIEKLLKEYEVEKVVVGVPPYGKTEKSVEKLKNWLESLKISVAVVDEHLTSKQAEIDMAGYKANLKKKWQDSVAAQLILQQYLE